MSSESVRARLAAATPGPWTLDSDGCCVYASDMQVLTTHTGEWDNHREADARLAALAPADLAAALAVIEAAKADPRVQRHIEGKTCECCHAESEVVEIDNDCPLRFVAHAVLAFEALP